MKQALVSLLPAALLVAAVLVAYAPAMVAGYVWDDDAHVTANETLRSTAGLRRMWSEPKALPQYYPLVHTTFWIERRLWGDEPQGYHVVNVVLHAGNALLLAAALRRLRVQGAWITALLFALHPVHVESVAWISERKNVLSTLFYLAALLSFLWYFGIERAETERVERPARRYALGTGLYLCALLAKTVTCSLPAALVLVLWWKRGRLARQELFALVPLFVAGVLFAALTAWLERHHVGAAGEAWNLTFPERLLVAGRALVFYASKLVWPAELSFNYPRWSLDPRAVLPYLPPLATVSVLAILWWARRRIGRGPLVATLFFAVTLFPALGFVDVYPMRYSFVADHFQYLASAGLLAVCGAGLARWRGRQAGVLVPAALAVALVVLGVMTSARARTFHDEETLWRDTLEKNPASFLAHNNLGLLLGRRGLAAQAEEHYRQALHANPEFAPAEYNLGNALTAQGRADEALTHYERAARIAPDDPKAHYNLGNALAQGERRREAIEHYEAALMLRPDFSMARAALRAARYELVDLLIREERFAEAAEELREVLRREPEQVEARFNLGLALVRLGQIDEAIAQYEQVLHLRPDLAEAHAALAEAERLRRSP